jgi:hypothetical protein
VEDDGWIADAGVSAPEPLDIDEPQTHVVRRSGGRVRLAIGALLVAGLLAGVLAVLANRDAEADPAEALAAAQDVVKDAGSYRFDIRQTSSMAVGDPDGAGSDTTTRVLTSGVVAAPDRWSITVDFGDDPMAGGTWDAIRIDDTLYSDTGAFYGSPDPEELPGPKWVAEPAEAYELTAEDIELAFEELGDYPDDAYRLDLTLAAYFMELDGDPTNLTRLVTDATDPVLEDELDDGTTVLQVRLAPLPAYERASDEPIPSVDLTLHVDDAHRPVLARFSASAGEASADVEVAFSDWGVQLTVDPPPDADIDQTPWIQEEALAQAEPTLLLAPVVLPTGGWVLSDAYRLLEDPEYDSCESVELIYSSDADRAFFESEAEMSPDELEDHWADVDYLSLSTSSLECMREADDTPFDQELGGFPARGAEGWWEVEVGDAAVYIDTSLSAEEIAPMVASLAPVTVDELAASIPAWVQEMATAGGW